VYRSNALIFVGPRVSGNVQPHRHSTAAGVRTRAIPRWVALLGFAVGILLLVTGGANRWVALAFPGWVLLLSVVILFTRPPDRTPAAP
jgi:hypothetical protein